MENYHEKLNKKKVLVTGGLGFVGHNLVKNLVDEYDCEVTVIDNCSNSSPNILKDYLGKINFIQGDILDLDDYTDLLEKVNFIFHLACIQIAASSKDPELDLQVNAKSTLAILEYLKKNKPEHFERFIYTSSASVYGNNTQFPLDEGSSKNVLSLYAATKLLGENYTLIYGNSYNVPVSVVRYSNVYGFGQTPENNYCGVLGRFIFNAINNRPLQVIGDGEQTRDYTFITDAVKATVLAAIHPAAINQAFNIGTSTNVSVNKLVELIKDNFGDVKVENISERDIDNIRHRYVSIEKIRQTIGWSPIINLQEGIRKTIADLTTNT